jgi:hypothetical protein
MSEEKIEFVIRARDEASKVLKDFEKNAQGIDKSLGGNAKGAEGFKVSIAGVAAALGTLAVAYAAFKAGEFVFTQLNSAADKFLELELDKGIDDTLKSGARQIEVATNIDERQIRDVMKSASESFDPSQIDTATRAAVGLSEAMGISLSDALDKVKQATDGNFEAFQGLIPGIDELSSAEEKLAAVSALASGGLDDKTAAANSARSVFETLATETENLMTSVGEAVEPFRTMVYQGILVVVEALNMYLEPAIESFKDYFSGMGDFISEKTKWFTESVVASLLFMETVWENLTTVLEIVGVSMMLSIEQWRSYFAHAFTVALPEYAMWFGRNFINILQDMAVSSSYILQNLIVNILDAFDKIFEFISGGWMDKDYGTVMAEIGAALTQDLLRGFEPVTEALPDVGERAVSNYEKTMLKRINDSTGKIANEFATKMEDEFDQRMEDLDQKMNEVEIDTKVNLNMRDDNNLKNHTFKALNAFESRVMVRGDTTDSPEKQTADSTKKIATQIDKVVAHLDNSRSNTRTEPTIEIVGMA